ncbi:hypothetical protein C8R46DRAFT_1196735 [Mycena filopes]|nr:hypothetical protein C8R46DRAFT_1196735 [Mycena filopes]
MFRLRTLSTLIPGSLGRVCVPHRMVIVRTYAYGLTPSGDSPARDASRPQKPQRGFVCYNSGGEEGHFADKCKKAPVCRVCGEEGHISRECAKADPTERAPRTWSVVTLPLAFVINHFPPPPAIAAAKKVISYQCGQPGHESRDCTEKKPREKRACFKCGSPDHLAAECTAPGDRSQPRERSRR